MSKPASINIEEKPLIIIRQYKRNDKLIYKRFVWFDNSHYILEPEIVENSSCYDLVYEQIVTPAQFLQILKKWNKKSYRCPLPTSLNNALKEKLGGDYILTADALGNEWSEKHNVLVHTLRVKKRFYVYIKSGAKRKDRKTARPLDYGLTLKGSKNKLERHPKAFLNE